MTYNLTNITSANTIPAILQKTNELSGNILFGSMLLILFLLFLVVFKGQSFKKVLMADSFFMVIICSIAYVLGWIGMNFLILPILLLFVSLMVYYFVSK